MLEREARKKICPLMGDSCEANGCGLWVQVGDFSGNCAFVALTTMIKAACESDQAESER